MGPPVYSLKVKYILNIHETGRVYKANKSSSVDLSVCVYICVLLYGTKFVPENDIMGESYPTVLNEEFRNSPHPTSLKIELQVAYIN